MNKKSYKQFKVGDTVKWKNAVSSFVGEIVKIKDKHIISRCDECDRVFRGKARDTTIIDIEYASVNGMVIYDLDVDSLGDIMKLTKI